MFLPLLQYSFRMRSLGAFQPKSTIDRRHPPHFLVCSQVPLYGIMSSDSSDPCTGCLSFWRLSAGPLWSLEYRHLRDAGTNLIEFDFGLKEERVLFSGAQNRGPFLRVVASRCNHLWCYVSGPIPIFQLLLPSRVMRLLIPN